MHCVGEPCVQGLQFGSVLLQCCPSSDCPTKPSTLHPVRVNRMTQLRPATTLYKPCGPPKFRSLVPWNGFTNPPYTGSGAHGTVPGLPASPGMPSAPGNVPKY